MYVNSLQWLPITLFPDDGDGMVSVTLYFCSDLKCLTAEEDFINDKHVNLN